MKKLLSLLVFTPFLSLSQENVDHNLIGWTSDNKVVYMEESFWHLPWSITIKVQNLITDKIEDFIEISTAGDGDALYLSNSNYEDTEMLPQYIEDSILSSNTMSVSYFENFLRMYRISKESISLYEDNYIEDYDLKIIVSLNEQYRNKTVFDVLVGSQVIGYKRIGSGSKADDVTIRGYYISPFDSRVLIVIETNTMHRGEEYFEGMENEMKLYYFGCSLNPSTFK